MLPLEVLAEADRRIFPAKRIAAGDQAVQPGIGFCLTPREVEVLRLLPCGLSNPEIAGALFVSRRTVQTHLTNVYGKLGVANRAEAIACAVHHGLADPLPHT